MPAELLQALLPSLDVVGVYMTVGVAANDLAMAIRSSSINRHNAKVTILTDSPLFFASSRIYGKYIFCDGGDQ